MHRLLLTLLACMLFTHTYATTWDEPWADKVIRQATSFVLAKVVENDEQKGVKISILKTLGGRELKDNLWINGFYLLDICSSSGHGPDLNIRETDSCFFFLKQDSTGGFCIATPTSGFSYVVNNNVVATYRHSYHMAQVPYNVYEYTMKAIFDHYHGLPYNTSLMVDFVKEQLGKKPASFF